MKCIIGTKQGMTQIFREDGTVVPVTRVLAGPCTITQVKTKEKDGVQSVQIGFGEQKVFRQPRAQQGHLQGLPSVRIMKEFRTTDADAHLERGTVFTVTTFAPGDKVTVTGTSKGKGFQGVVKRHGFAGAQATHGTKDQIRMPGSNGATGPARVFKGSRMGGQMGNVQVSVNNLEIVAIDEAKGELLIKGAVPGAKGGYIFIYTPEGTISPVVVSTEVVQPEEAPVSESNTDVTSETTDTTEIDTSNDITTPQGTEEDTPAPTVDASNEETQA